MISFCIKSSNLKAIDYLMNKISNINLDNIIFSQRHFSKYTNIILHYNGVNKSTFYNELSNCLCNCITNIYEHIIIQDIIYSNYFYFDYNDIKKIENNCCELISNNCFNNNCHYQCNIYNNKDINNINDIDFKDRKIVLWTDILKYITSNKSILIDGFVRFRIKKYIGYLDNAVDIAVNQFVIDKEYYDFIDLVKLYINSKPSQTDYIYLIYSNKKSILLDKNNKVIDCSNNPDINYISDISFSSNDYILDMILSLLPESIKIKLVSPEDEFINTLKLIFEDRISIVNNIDTLLQDNG